MRSPRRVSAGLSSRAALVGKIFLRILGVALLGIGIMFLSWFVSSGPASTVAGALTGFMLFLLMLAGVVLVFS